MSGGQRKRVTFADLVSARLPTDTQKTSDSNQPVSGAAQGPDSSRIDTPPPEEAIQTEAPSDLGKPVADGDGVDSTHTTDKVELTTLPAAQIHAEENRLNQPPHDRQTLDGSQLPDDSRSPDDSQTNYVRQPSNVRRTFQQAEGGQINSQPHNVSEPASDRQPPADRHPLREVKGYLKLPNTLVDSLLPTLDVYEQAVFIQLYRLSHGFGNYTCKISLPALQARAGVKATSLKLAVARLQARGIIEKISADIGFGREQGITYWVSQDGRQTYGDWQASSGRQSPGDDNKRKEVSKEINLKGGLTPEQIKSCPDCGGVGMWYPGGPGKGVARCYHPSLRSKS